MGYQIAFSPSARRDLRAIVRYISLDSPERATGFGQFLVNGVKRLADLPEMGRVVPEFNDPCVRSYRVIYHVDHGGRRVDVLRFWHGARGTPHIGDG